MKKLIKKIFLFFGIQVSKIMPSNGQQDNFSLHDQTSPLEWMRQYGFNTIIDVGANIGQFSEKIVRVFPNATIHGFEPLHLAYNQLTENFKDNKNIHTYHFGLGENDSEVEINHNEYSPSSSLLEMLDSHKSNFGFAVKSAPEKIKIRRLDDVLGGKLNGPTLLKIDVQGYEMNVLKGGSQIVNQAMVVIIETTFVSLYKDQPLFAEIYNYFTTRGFEYAGNLEQLLSPKNGQILQADAIFIKQ